MLVGLNKTRVTLARYYAGEAIISTIAGDVDRAREELGFACDYLAAMLGRPVTADEPSDVIALCCGIETGEIAIAEDAAA